MSEGKKKERKTSGLPQTTSPQVPQGQGAVCLHQTLRRWARSDERGLGQGSEVHTRYAKPQTWVSLLSGLLFTSE